MITKEGTPKVVPTGDKSSMLEEIEKFLGQPAAVICARYQYRGEVAKILSDGFVLANACAVETSGATQSASPEREDIIGSSIFISAGAIELFYQPKWCFHKLPGAADADAEAAEAVATEA